MSDDKQTICDLLRAFIHQRPGLDFANYGDVSAYRSESRAITRDLHDAQALLAYVERHDSIDADRLRAAFRDAYSGRLVLSKLQDDRPCLDYCTGQYWPTEYRRAACAVLASAIWDWMRDNITADRAKDHTSVLYRHKSIGDALRAAARREMGAAIARRWFN